MSLKDTWARLRRRPRTPAEPPHVTRLAADYDRRVLAAQREAMDADPKDRDRAWAAWERLYDARRRFHARHRSHAWRAL